MSLPLLNAVQISGLDQDQSNLLHLLGYHHLQHGNASHAALIFESALSFDPLNEKIVQGLACAYLRDGLPEQALSLLEKLTHEHKANALTWLLKGQAFTKTGRVAEAAGAMRMFIQMRAAENLQDSPQ
jgi:Flp pilus assembly protein TadD